MFVIMKKTEFQKLNDKILTNKNSIRELKLKVKSLEMKFVALEKSHNLLCNSIIQYFNENKNEFECKKREIGFNYPNKPQVDEFIPIEHKRLESPLEEE